jgi:hypothetical protein
MKKGFMLKFVVSFLALGLFSAVPKTQVAEAQSCGCTMCGCYTYHPVTGVCAVPNVEPCGCWKCMGDN